MRYSIIIPVYNVEKYLQECLQSILSQSYRDYEIILVNDGSTDGSPNICEEYERKFSNITVVNQANQGLSVARNNGLIRAKGDYIVFIDSDDFIISNDFLSSLEKKVVLSPDVVFYKYARYYESSKQMVPCAFSYLSAIAQSNQCNKVMEMVKSDAFYGMAWIKCVRRELLTKNQIYFEPGLLGEDTDWNFNLLLHTNSLELIDEAFIAYRQREGSISQSLRIKNLTDFINVMSKWMGKVDKLEDQVYRKALLGALAKYYSNLLIVYMRVKDSAKIKYKQRIKDMSWVLDYAVSRRPLIISKVYKLIKFNLTVFLLSLIDHFYNV